MTYCILRHRRIGLHLTGAMVLLSAAQACFAAATGPVGAVFSVGVAVGRATAGKDTSFWVILDPDPEITQLKAQFQYDPAIMTPDLAPDRTGWLGEFSIDSAAHPDPGWPLPDFLSELSVGQARDNTSPVQPMSDYVQLEGDNKVNISMDLSGNPITLSNSNHANIFAIAFDLNESLVNKGMFIDSIAHHIDATGDGFLVQDPEFTFNVGCGRPEGCRAGEVAQGFSLSVVPEPASVLPLSLGMISLFYLRHRR